MRSTDRFLTTHAGSLPKSTGIAAMHVARSRGEDVDAAAMAEQVAAFTAATVARQIETGIDVVNNGEIGRESFFTYIRERMDGFGGRSSRATMADLVEYPSFMERLLVERATIERVTLMEAPQAIGEVTYRSDDAIRAECDQLGRILADHAGAYVDSFVSAPSPGIVAAAMQNAHYADLESYVGALGEALRTEYAAIVDAGHVLQIDAPDLALERHTLFQDRPLADFRAFVTTVLDAIRAALVGIDPDRVRLHVCWGNYEGPHDLDVDLDDIWDLVREAPVGGFLLSMANPRHAHEWRALADGGLPDGAFVAAGVIDTTTNYVEHPDAVADRIIRVVEAVGDPSRVLAGTDCGFETSAGFATVAADVAWVKLRSLCDGARRASQRVFGTE